MKNRFAVVVTAIIYKNDLAGFARESLLDLCSETSNIVGLVEDRDYY